MKKLVFILIFCLCGCVHKQTQILPSSDTIIKLKSDEKIGIIAESQTYSYQFTSADAIDKLKSYRNFLAEYKNDIEKVSITFFREHASDEMIVRYSNLIPEKTVLNNNNFSMKSKSEWVLKDGYYQVSFSTKGNAYKQANTLSDQYLLPTPITVLVKPRNEIKASEDITGDVAGLIILPVFIPLMMISCIMGPC
ncbi:hypothetical protein A9G28_00010 [Gilliamella sp. Fer1-1]|jgi:hypothetical protein|uniref:hypothetical protein n=1 Tax=unclassified Gilliamella TaxID=2685620 RepID=UPI00080E9D75|nr:hypothetical protein [Gilliamella apicola]OCG27169.1 hypothetical protein A9G45_09555 [Gilliamella apicola]OCG29277.1 hypothetical protein A9G46_00935 [Gilliamella apicola]OCG33061.1 hypothetical protein A9G29_04880 [Gilliamella apicola]OCG46331.1 hypothetical protein A9G28_00010 [Gilliamella apicola]OCG62139.1 hypothetical protein A9G30_09535 [Gilliamella apicola]